MANIYKSNEVCCSGQLNPNANMDLTPCRPEAISDKVQNILGKTKDAKSTIYGIKDNMFGPESASPDNAKSSPECLVDALNAITENMIEICQQLSEIRVRL